MPKDSNSAFPAFLREGSFGTLDEEARTVEVTFTTGAAVRRRVHVPGEGARTVWEVLEVTDKAVDLDRLKRGAPVLDTHDSWDLSRILGVVEEARIEEGKGIAKIRFPSDEDGQRIFNRVKEGIVRNVSVGYVIHEFEVDEASEKGGLDTWRAVRWEPMELSFVPIPADKEAQVRASAEGDVYPCVIRRATEGGPDMADDNQRLDKETQKDTKKGERTSDAVNTPEKKSEDPKAIRAAEKQRIADIRRIGTRLAVKEDVIQAAIDDDVPVEEFRAEAVESFAESSRTHDVSSSTAIVTADAQDKFVEGARKAIYAKVGLEGGERNEFSSMSLVELARHSLSVANISNVAGDRMSLVGQAFTAYRAGGMHTTSDFASILADVANKSALRGWNEADETYPRFTRAGSLSDFKTAQRVNVNLYPDLPKVVEGAEFTYGTVGDRGEPIVLATYGRLLRISRQAIINDDLGLLGRSPELMGRAARRTIGDLVFAVLTSNPNMSDGNALFDNANHGNDAASGGAPSATTIQTALTAMALQQDPEGNATALNIRPRYMLSPVGQQFSNQVLLTSAVLPGGTNDEPNPIRGQIQELITDGRLDAASTTAWYLAADPNVYDTIEVAYLDGVQEPFLDQMTPWHVDGVEMKVRIDAGVAPLDWRTLYRNVGA